MDLRDESGYNVFWGVLMGVAVVVADEGVAAGEETVVVLCMFFE